MMIKNATTVKVGYSFSADAGSDTHLWQSWQQWQVLTIIM